MGLYVHLSVIFACDRNEGVAALAAKHLPLLAFEPGENRETEWFLRDLAGRTGNNPGPKGGLSMWGTVGNYTRPEEFVEKLRPPWKELLSGIDGGPCSFEHILVFGEREQTERTTAYEIFMPEDSDGLTIHDADLIVKVHECPFAFMQF